MPFIPTFELQRCQSNETLRVKRNVGRGQLGLSFYPLRKKFGGVKEMGLYGSKETEKPYNTSWKKQVDCGDREFPENESKQKSWFSDFVLRVENDRGYRWEVKWKINTSWKKKKLCWNINYSEIIEHSKSSSAFWQTSPVKKEIQ